MQIFIIWLVIRILTSLTAILASPLRRLTDLERNIPIWPPSDPLHSWLSRLFLAPLNRWDVKWYIKIVTQGYSNLNGTTQFHPLYPTFAAIFHKFNIDPLVSLLIVSSITSITMLFMFDRLAKLDLDKKDALFALLVFVVSPTAFVFFAPYPESMFLLFTISCFYFSRQQKWWYASLAGAFAVLTRQQGLFLIFPLAWEYWETKRQNLRGSLMDWKNWLSFSLIPLAMVGWIGYRAIILNDLHPRITSLNTFIYSILISSKANQVVPNQVFLPPWQTIGLAVKQVLLSPDADLIANLIGGLFFCILFILVWPYLRISYRIYSALIVLVSFSYYTGYPHPLMGLLRHLMLAFPVYIGLPKLFPKPVPRVLLITFSVTSMFFLLTLYVFEAWVV